jgi:uncharacterized membrane protein YdfJ with MMPL/SSD domain
VNPANIVLAQLSHLSVLEPALVELLAGEGADGWVHAVLHVQHVDRVATALQEAGKQVQHIATQQQLGQAGNRQGEEYAALQPSATI